MLFEHLPDPVRTLDELKEIGTDSTFYYIEVPSENPFVKENKFSISKNIRLLLNPLYNKWKLIRYYFKQRRMPFMPMKEHVNFFTIQSMKTFVENNNRFRDFSEDRLTIKQYFSYCHFNSLFNLNLKG